MALVPLRMAAVDDEVVGSSGNIRGEAAGAAWCGSSSPFVPKLGLSLEFRV